MKLLLVEITKEDNAWKGTWYKVGQRHFVTIERRYPAVMLAKYSAIDLCGGIMETDCKVLTDWRSRVRCFFRGMWKSEWQRHAERIETACAEMAAGDPDSTWGKARPL